MEEQDHLCRVLQNSCLVVRHYVLCLRHNNSYVRTECDVNKIWNWKKWNEILQRKLQNCKNCFHNVTHSYVMTWLALSWEGLIAGTLLFLLLLASATLVLRPAPGAGHRGLPAEVMSSRSRSCSFAWFSFCRASYSTSGWFQIWKGQRKRGLLMNRNDILTTDRN